MTWDGREPHHTIYRPGWQEAQTRIGQIEPRGQELFRSLLDHIESGWINFIRQLQLFYEDNRDRQAMDQGMADVLAFIDGDIVDLYRVIASDAADLVPGWEGWAAAADPGGIDGYVSCFVRYLGVFRLTVPSLPYKVEGLEEFCPDMREWGDELCRLLKRVDDEVIRRAEPSESWL